MGERKTSPERNNWLRPPVLSLHAGSPQQSRPTYDFIIASGFTAQPWRQLCGLLQPAAANRGKVGIMPDTQAPTTELTSQYSAQVANDLERNAKEQERISAEIDALQEQLRALRHDHTVLTNMQKALGSADTATQPAAEETAAPSVPRQKTDTEPGAGKRARAKKTPAVQDGKVAKKPASKKPTAVPEATAAKASQPTLVELIRRHLTDQSEPRSAAEIATALGQAHPGRTIKATVVRTTVEGLVAKSHAQRTKQGSSVYYTATDTPEPTAPVATPADARPETN
ncbi:hypothetical protein [Streptomyces lutosisoli]|uniref:Regulatory protein n=1 Tax=Streptomyces lutosisoli TaxID=2665721 RepID=A0ABW2VSV5_9ACTN